MSWNSGGCLDSLTRRGWCFHFFFSMFFTVSLFWGERPSQLTNLSGQALNQIQLFGVFTMWQTSFSGWSLSVPKVDCM